ncbi:chromate transporter, partial [Falsiroseomonas sp.]|uniref:chromate transporter n=1 Tax=Falsiroseomonas sp. TaxID=2870721 RepID=UPI00272631E9
LCRMASEADGAVVAFPVSRRIGILSLALFFLLLAGLPLLAAATGLQGVALTDAFYRTGALVFGGGHVILPLLEAETVRTGWVESDVFLAGYGAAQAIPGPLSAFAAYLGAALGPEPNGLAGASIALVAIFLPGFLLLVGVMPFWNEFRTQSSAQALMRGANAAVVGILGAALYDPVWTSTIKEPAHFALALTGFLLLTVWKAPPWVVVILSALGGVLISLMLK